MSKTYEYIGSWIPKKEPADSGLKHGFYVYEYNEETGAMTLKSTTCDWLSVGAAYVDNSKGVLYCTHESSNHPDAREGGGGLILAFSINKETGELTELSRVPSYGANPSMLVTDPESKYLISTNYGFRTTITKTVKDAFGKYHIVTEHDESNVMLFPLAENGAILDPVDIYVISGEGPASFQVSPHAHSVQRSPSGKLYFVCDKGGDQVFMFKINYETQKLELCPNSPFKSEPATAPRYSAFHPTLPYIVYNKENKTILSVLKYDDNGSLKHVCTVSALPDDIKDPKKLSQSDIVFSADGKYVYDLLRIVEVISVFEFTKDGQLNLIQTIPVSCEGPRGCRISPDGRFLHVAALKGNKVEVYPIGSDGKLSAPTTADCITPGTVSFYKS